MTDHSGRSGSGRLPANFAAKGVEVRLVQPLHRRHWFRRLVFVTGCAAGLAAAAALGFFQRWHDDRLAEFARQHRCLETFLASPEFAEFGRAMDAHFVAMSNFIVVRPHEAGAALPVDRGSDGLPWSLDWRPVPRSAAADPARVGRLGRDLSRSLAQRGFVFDDAQRRDGRQLLLRLLRPQLAAFVRRAPEYTFQALFLDRAMQERVLAAFAARHGPEATLHDSERLFALYARLGPSLWQAIEREQRAGPTLAGALP